MPGSVRQDSPEYPRFLPGAPSPHQVIWLGSWGVHAGEEKTQDTVGVSKHLDPRKKLQGTLSGSL